MKENKTTMSEVDKALKEEDKRDDVLAKDIASALNVRDYKEECVEEHSAEADLNEDTKDEVSAVKKVFRAEDRARNEEEHRCHCGCHKH